MSQKLFLLYLLIHVSSLKAEEPTYVEPTLEDIMNVNLLTLDYSLLQVETNKKDCQEQLQIKPEVKNKIFCFCDVDKKDPVPDIGPGIELKSKWKKVYPFLGELQSIEYKFSNGNDNFLNGVLQYSPSLRKFDGDDKGRTFGIENQLKLFGKEGDISLSANSYGLGKLTDKNGSKTSFNNKRYLNYLEVNTLSLKFDSVFSKSESPSLKTTDYSIATFMYEQSTENGKYSKELQRWWHHQFKNFIQYDYVTESEDVNTIKVMGGIGREIIANLGNWKCTSRAELQIGMSQSSSASKQKSSFNSEVSAYGSMNLTHSKVPWMALNVWLQSSKGYEGVSKDGGIEISFPIKQVNYTLKPFLGIQRHSNDRDKKYGKTNENYHVLGVMIQY